MSQRSWWLCGNFARIHARDCSQKHRMLGKYHKLPPSCASSKHKSVFDCSLFFHPLGYVCCVLCVLKEMWNTPGRRWEKLLDELLAMSGLRGWDSGDRPAVYCHTTKKKRRLYFLAAIANSHVTFKRTFKNTSFCQKLIIQQHYLC